METRQADEGKAPFGTTMNQTYDNYLDFMSYLNEAAPDLAKRLLFDKKHPWHLALVSLYGTMLELLRSIHILVRERITIGVPILLRSVVEANLDFTNLANDKKYGYHLDAAELKEWINIHREAKKGDNPFLAGFADAPNLEETLSHWESELARLKAGGYRPLRQDEKFAKDGQSSEYRAVYKVLCWHSHNTLWALRSRHVNISPDETDFDVEYYAPPDMHLLLPYLESLCAIIVSSTETIHLVLDTGAEEDVQKLKKQLAELKERIQTEQEN